MFCTIKFTRNTDKSKLASNAQGIAFDGKDFWSFDNSTVWKVIIFGVNNGSSYYIDNPKKTF